MKLIRVMLFVFAAATALPAQDVDWKAKWIWDSGEASPRNVYLCARRAFDANQRDGASHKASWSIRISADSRYRLWVNGEWIGDGPARSFAFNKQYDRYDVSGVVREGRNVIAILAAQYGEGTFQYNPSGRAGILVQLEQPNLMISSGSHEHLPDGKIKDTSIVFHADPWLWSDKTWQVRRHPGYLRPTMRISCQMPFEEIFDARGMDDSWITSTEEKLPGFEPATELGPVGMDPWKKMVPRTVPFYTREPVTPVRLWRAGAVKRPDLEFGFTLRPYLLPGYVQQNHKPIPGFAATVIVSPKEQPITICNPSTGRFEWPVINGVVTKDGEPAILRKGENLCVIPVRPGDHHEYDRSYAAFVEEPVTLKGLFQDSSPWTVFGPFEDYGKINPAVRKAATVADLEPFKEKARPVAAEHLLTHGSPWNQAAFARPVQAASFFPTFRDFFTGGAQTGVVLPCPGGDTEMFMDFGKELVGYLELDVDGAAGTTLDATFLEEIEEGKADRIHYTDGNQNGFRYILRDGRQQYVTFLRRGYRYARMIVHDQKTPLTIRAIRTLFATHPVNERGAFACSDAKLTKIWEVGRHTLRCCSEDTFTDCPTYEQTYWVGDGRNEGMVTYATYGHLALTRRAAELPPESMFRQLIPESQVPSAWDNLLTAWALLWIQISEEHYWFSGDKDYLKGIYPSVRTAIHNCREKLTDERGLLSIQAWNFFDWAGMDLGHRVTTPNQMLLAEGYRRAEFMAKELGEASDAAWFAGEREALVKAINAHLWDEAKGAYIDSIHDDGKPSPKVSQQSNSLALVYGIAPPERASKIRDVPVKPFPDMVTFGSPFALFYGLDALVAQGRFDEMVSIVRDRWGSMTDKGATTFWETFPQEQGWWTRSYCHAWSAAPTYFLSRHVLGAWWDAPGYSRARIAPKPCGLTWARGRVPTPKGEIEVAWEAKDKVFRLEVALPAGTEGVIELPGHAGDYAKIETAGLSPAVEGDRWVVRVPAGWRGVAVGTAR